MQFKLMALALPFMIAFAVGVQADTSDQVGQAVSVMDIKSAIIHVQNGVQMIDYKIFHKMDAWGGAYEKHSDPLDFASAAARQSFVNKEITFPGSAWGYSVDVVGFETQPSEDRDVKSEPVKFKILSLDVNSMKVLTEAPKAPTPPTP